MMDYLREYLRLVEEVEPLEGGGPLEMIAAGHAEYSNYRRVVDMLLTQLPCDGRGGSVGAGRKESVNEQNTSTLFRLCRRRNARSSSPGLHEAGPVCACTTASRLSVPPYGRTRVLLSVFHAVVRPDTKTPSLPPVVDGQVKRVDPSGLSPTHSAMCSRFAGFPL